MRITTIMKEEPGVAVRALLNVWERWWLTTGIEVMRTIDMTRFFAEELQRVAQRSVSPDSAEIVLNVMFGAELMRLYYDGGVDEASGMVRVVPDRPGDRIESYCWLDIERLRAFVSGEDNADSTMLAGVLGTAEDLGIRIVGDPPTVVEFRDGTYPSQYRCGVCKKMIGGDEDVIVQRRGRLVDGGKSSRRLVPGTVIRVDHEACLRGQRR